MSHECISVLKYKYMTMYITIFDGFYMYVYYQIISVKIVLTDIFNGKCKLRPFNWIHILSHSIQGYHISVIQWKIVSN